MGIYRRGMMGEIDRPEITALSHAINRHTALPFRQTALRNQSNEFYL